MIFRDKIDTWVKEDMISIINEKSEIINAKTIYKC